MNKKTNASIITGALLMALASPAFATEAGDWSVSVGFHSVDPASDNGTLADGAFEVDVGSAVWRAGFLFRGLTELRCRA